MVESFFPGFQRSTVTVRGADINVVCGGSGPPVLLVHGYPQTHVEWRHVAPELAKSHTVVLVDLRGYGDSSKPASDASHEAYSKRAMALDLVDVMLALEFDTFDVLAHDRGARVAHRLMLDHADRVSRAMLLDICPTIHMYGNANRTFASAYFHWFFLIQDAPLPEQFIGSNVQAWLNWFYRPEVRDRIGPDAMSEYIRCFSDPETIHASCEDYRASATIDLEHDRFDKGRKVTTPLRVLWGSKGLVGQIYDVVLVWETFAEKVTGRAIDCGHWLPEEAPQEVVAEARAFFN